VLNVLGCGRCNRLGTISVFNFAQFSFRSSERDKATDQARIDLIRGAIGSAISNAEKELEGLGGRVEKARQTASMLVANAENDGISDSGYHLKRVEERLMVAEKRATQLRSHLAALHRIGAAFDVEFSI
jgi:hypothetical protein